MPGILSRLGSWGKRIIQSAIETGRTIAETVGFVRPLAPEITIPEVTREWGHVSASEQAEAIILDLPDEEYVPDRLHSIADVPFKRPYAYTVSIYGRDLVGQQPGGKGKGQFIRQDYDLTSSRKLKIGEIKDMAAQRIGSTGVSATTDIFSMEVSNAWVRKI